MTHLTEEMMVITTVRTYMLKTNNNNNVPTTESDIENLRNMHGSKLRWILKLPIYP